jgi:ubiquinone/menaquinone biosynthesis C-methylase UbiE
MSTHNTAPERSAKEQFDRQAAQYDSQWNTWSEESLAWLLANAKPKPTDKVLDVATGSGFTALAFARFTGEVVGVDVSTGMLEEARNRARVVGIDNVTFIESPAESLPFDDSSFDIVTCRIAAHHFLDIRAFLAETARVLKPHGRFVIADTTVPDEDPDAARWQNTVEVIRDPSHVCNYSPREWMGLVEQAGLTVQTVSDSGGGITIPMNDWVRKAGCTPEQVAQVRRLFETAPPSARALFGIQTTRDDIVFTWKRIVLAANKS